MPRKGNYDPRLLIVARDKYPAFRVDITQLFSHYLAKDFQIDWVMRDSLGGTTRIEGTAREKVYVIGGRGIKGLWAQLKVHKAAFKRILSGSYEIVQCRDAFQVAWLYALVARIAGVPFTYWMSYPIELGYLDRARRELQKKNFFSSAIRGLIGLAGRITLYGCTLPLAQHIFVQSDEMKKYVARSTVPETKITPVPMGIDTSRFKQSTTLPSDDPRYLERFVVLYSGTLDLSRRMEVPAEGVARFCESKLQAVFSVIGQSSQEEKEAILIPFRARGMADRVLFTDFVPLEELLCHVVRADVCLAPYPAHDRMLSTSTPTKLVEYIAMGRNIVANNHPDQTKIADALPFQVTLCQFSVEGFAEALAESSKKFELEKSELAAAQSWIAAERSYAKLAKRVGSVYEKLVTTKRNSAPE